MYSAFWFVFLLISCAWCNLLCFKVKSSFFESLSGSAVSWSQDWGGQTRALAVLATDLLHPAGMQFFCLPDEDDIYAPTSQLMDYCLK